MNELRSLEEKPPECACCGASAPSPACGEARGWTFPRFTVDMTSVTVSLLLCPACSKSDAALPVRDPIIADALRAAGCTCEPIAVIDCGELATGHDDECTMLRRERGV
jgi:hypothetical protein